MNINKIINNNDLDAILVTSLINIRYLSNFSGSEALVLVSTNKKYIFVDSRYFEQAQKQCIGFKVILHSKANIISKLNQIMTKNNIKRLGFESSRLIVDDYFNFKAKLNCELIGISIDEIRMCKTNEEISLIEKACEITDLAFSHLISFIKIGMCEKEVNIELQKFILDHGASGLSFETIIASGQRGSMPHGVASDKLIEENDFVTIDFGVFYNGYCSDMTRTFVVGNNPNQHLIEVYEIVKEAQKRAVEAIKPKMVVSKIDKIARDYIIEKGYGEYFGHGLGHSIGLEIHELPFLNKTSLTKLEPGHIITIEPGIYLPNIGGVRIEDDVLVTKTGYRVLNKSTKELLKIDGR